MRSCVAVSHPGIVVDGRSPLEGVVPVTGTPAKGALYPPLEPGESGLRTRSYALVGQLRSVDKRRIHRAFGRVLTEELQRIDEGLVPSLGLDAQEEG